MPKSYRLTSSCEAYAQHAPWYGLAYARHMRFQCRANAFQMQFICHPYAIQMPFICHSNAILMTVSCHSHAILMPFKRHFHAIHAQLSCNSHVGNVRMVIIRRLQGACRIRRPYLRPDVESLQIYVFSLLAYLSARRPYPIILFNRPYV